MKLRMFHVPKPRKFNYTPVYYTPDEEEKLEKSGRAKEKKILEEGKNKYWTGEFNKRNRSKSINITMYIFIALLLLYIIFFT